MRRLLAEPYRFQFAQLINILVRDLRVQGVSYDEAFAQVLRFRNSVSMGFPASEVEGIKVGLRDQPDRRRIAITPAFIGVLGASGALPLHDTERIAAALINDKDESRIAFIDLLSNRAIGLFYEAWGKYRVEQATIARGQDRLLPILTALAGMDGRHSAPSPAVPAYYAALLRTKPISGGSIGRVLAEYFAVPVRLEEFAGGWEIIPPGQRSTLGVTDSKLGFGAVIGTRMWRNDLRAILHIGPMSYRQAKDFLPHGAARVALEEMLALFHVPHVQYEARLILDAPSIQALTLSNEPEQGRQLGWNAFLTNTPGKARRADIRFPLRLPTT